MKWRILKDMETVVSTTIAQTQTLAQMLTKRLCEEKNVVCLSGDLGSGKTTLTQGMLRYCGAEGPYTSPTFTIMKHYKIATCQWKAIYHIDAYRINSGDMLELGWREIVNDPRNLVIVEWSERIADILPADAVHVSCEWVDETTRKYTIN